MLANGLGCNYPRMLANTRVVILPPHLAMDLAHEKAPSSTIALDSGSPAASQTLGPMPHWDTWVALPSEFYAPACSGHWHSNHDKGARKFTGRNHGR